MQSEVETAWERWGSLQTPALGITHLWEAGAGRPGPSVGPRLCANSTSCCAGRCHSRDAACTPFRNSCAFLPGAAGEGGTWLLLTGVIFDPSGSQSLQGSNGHGGGDRDRARLWGWRTPRSPPGSPATPPWVPLRTPAFTVTRAMVKST